MSLLNIWKEIVNLKLEDWEKELENGNFNNADEIEKDIEEFNNNLIEDLIEVNQNKSEEELKSVFNIYTNFRKSIILNKLEKVTE